jgi:protein SCO1/2
MLMTDKPRRRDLLLTLLSLPVLGAASDKPNSVFKSGVFEPPRMAPEFTLNGSDGAPLTLSSHRGKVVALAFGFTYCQKVCPVTLAKLAQVSQGLGAAARELQVVFVTVDPERDTVGRLREFLGFFHPTFLGATGEKARLEALREAYGVSASRVTSENEKLGYEVHHSSSVYLIDRAGLLRLLVPFGKSSEDILHDVQLLLKK